MKNKKYKKTIAKKTALGLIVLGIFMIIFVSISVYLIDAEEMDKEYEALTLSYNKAASEYIDGDYVKKLVNTPDKDKGKFYNDKYYQEIKKYLESVLDNSNVKYFYVFEPRENDLKYLWDSDTVNSPKDLSNNHEEYMTNGKKYSMDAFSNHPKTTIKYFDDEKYGRIVSSFYPILDSKDNPVALLGVDINTSDIFARLNHFIWAVMGAVLTVTLISILAWYLFMKKKLIAPLHTLNDVSKNMVTNLKEDEDIELNINTHDEIEELADSFKYMNTELKDYINKISTLTAEKERIGAELDIANEIQSAMLPNTFPPFPERTEFDLHASMDAAKEVGGDFYDYFMIDDDHIALVIADVSGKGVPAALQMMATKIITNNFAMSYPESPAKILEKVNKQVCENNTADMFVTVWLGILEISTGTLTCANAGHEYPAIYRDGASYQLFKDKHGLVLGGMPEAKYTEYTIQLNKGDVIYLYTDGVPEATDKDLNQMGMDYMLDALNHMPSTNPESVIKEMHNAINDFIKGAEQFDDVTMLCLRYNG